MDWTLIIDIVGTIIGLVYLWLEYRASIWLWLAGVIMPIINAWLYFHKGLYADFGMETYYVLAAIYGYLMWRNGKKSADISGDGDSPRSIRHASAATLSGIMAVISVAWACLFWFLSTCTDSTVPILDSLTTAISIVAMWALAQKYVEQWLLWFVVDVICTGLYVYKGIPFHGVLYGFYTIMAIVGYRKWSRMAATQAIA